MDAQRIVSALLETDDFDPKDMALDLPGYQGYVYRVLMPDGDYLRHGDRDGGYDAHYNPIFIRGPKDSPVAEYSNAHEATRKKNAWGGVKVVRVKAFKPIRESDDFDPMTEIERMEVPPILAELGFIRDDHTSTNFRQYFGWYKLINERNKLIVVVPKGITRQAREMCNVKLFVKAPDGRWIFKSNQPVSVVDLPVLLKNYLRWFEQSQIQESVEPAGPRQTFRPGETVWFEYHCDESDNSADTALRDRSHQQVKILKLDRTSDGWTTGLATRDDRCAEGCPIAYEVVFKDGFKGTAVEDELSYSQDEWVRPDPPHNRNQAGMWRWNAKRGRMEPVK